MRKKGGGPVRATARLCRDYYRVSGFPHTLNPFWRLQYIVYSGVLNGQKASSLLGFTPNSGSQRLKDPLGRGEGLGVEALNPKAGTGLGFRV